MSGYLILAISGSLRGASLNTAMLNMASACSPPGMHVSLHASLGNLPLFNPDIESHAPSAVIQLLDSIVAADALLIASPEYAHGISSVIKNALDWMVGSGVLVDKPVVLLSASQRSTYAYEALKTTITTMSGNFVTDASITLPLLGRNLDAAGIAADPEIARILVAALETFERAIARARA